MARTVSTFKLGLFILICGSLALITVVWLGASHYFEETKIYVSYFDESVKGLQKDAIVNYRGVALGRVAAIGLAPAGRLIEVRMHLKPDFRIDKSLGIQLREQGLTGMRYLEIDTAPGNVEQLTPKIDFPVKYPLIPSYPSEMAQLKNALETIYQRINSLDLKALTDNWTRTAELINGFLAQVEGAIQPQDWRDTVKALKKTAQDSAQFMSRLSNATTSEGMKRGIQDLSATLAASRKAADTLSKQLQAAPPNTIAGMAKHWDDTMKTGATMFGNVDQKVSESAVLLEQSLQQLKLLLAQLNGLVQALKEQPNRLVFPSSNPDPFKRK